MSIRVLIADDHPLIRYAMRNELDNQPDIEIVGEASSGDEALQLAEEYRPNMLLLDIHMPGMKTVQILSRLRRTVPETRVIILTACDDAPTVLGMLREGVNGYFVKDENPQILVEAIQVVMRGKTWLSPTVAGVVAGALSDVGQKGAAPLTERELEILGLLGQGYSTERIGEELFISTRTVRFHIERTLEKLGVHNRMEAFAIAVKNGWIQV